MALGLSLSTIRSSASTSTGLLSVSTATSAATATASARDVKLLLLDTLEAEELGSGAGGNRVHISASDVVLSGNDSELGGVVVKNLLLGVLNVLTSSCFLQELVLGLLGFVVSKVDSGKGLFIFLGSLLLFFASASISVRFFLVLDLGLFLITFFLLSLFSFDFFLNNGGSGLLVLVLAGTSLPVTALSLDFLANSAGLSVHGVILLTRLSLVSFDFALTTVVVLGTLGVATFNGSGSTVKSGSVLGTSASTTLSVATRFATAATASFTVAASAVVGTTTTTFGLWAITAFAAFAGATAAAGSAWPIATTASSATASSSTIFTFSTSSRVDVETTLLELSGTEDGLLGFELDLLLFAVATALLLRLLDGSDGNLGS